MAVTELLNLGYAFRRAWTLNQHIGLPRANIQKIGCQPGFESVISALLVRITGISLVEKVLLLLAQ